MALKNDSSNYTFLNIKEGRLKLKDGDDVKTFTSIEGRIKRVEFSIEEYEGTMYEKAKIHITDDADVYVLQMNTNSGYFRGLFNSLKTSLNPYGFIEITPSYKKCENGNPKTTCFVKQSGENLKHAFTKENSGKGEYPQVETSVYDGKTTYNSTAQILYWKDWINKTFNSGYDIKPIEKTDRELTPIEKEIVDDLPF